jgi:integration host factor subunit beta
LYHQEISQFYISKGTTMNKSDLIAQLAGKMDIPTKEATAIINTLLDKMTDALAQGENIEIRGFGSFMVKDYKSYAGRNPKSGETFQVPPKKLPVFKVGRELRERVNEGE